MPKDYDLPLSNTVSVLSSGRCYHLMKTSCFLAAWYSDRLQSSQRTWRSMNALETKFFSHLLWHDPLVSWGWTRVTENSLAYSVTQICPWKVFGLSVTGLYRDVVRSNLPSKIRLCKNKPMETGFLKREVQAAQTFKLETQLWNGLEAEVKWMSLVCFAGQTDGTERGLGGDQDPHSAFLLCVELYFHTQSRPN